MLVGDKKECSGTDKIFKGNLLSGADCAVKCMGTASMFIFGTNDYGGNRCNADGCQCRCELASTTDGQCDQTDHNGYRLYKYGKPGNPSVY